MATGRTPSKYLRFILKDSGAVLREIGVNSIGNVGLSFPEVDLSAFQDAVKGFLTGQPDFSLEFGGPFLNTAAAANAASGAVPVLSGSHTVLNNLPGGVTPLSWQVLFGIQNYWSTGDPAFGITSTATAGVLVMNYTPVLNGEGWFFTARIRMFPGSTAPVWSTSLVT